MFEDKYLEMSVIKIKEYLNGNAERILSQLSGSTRKHIPSMTAHEQQCKGVMNQFQFYARMGLLKAGWYSGFHLPIPRHCAFGI